MNRKVFYLCVACVAALSAALSAGPPMPAGRPLFLVLLVDTSGSMASSDPNGATQHAMLTALDLVVYEKPVVSILEFSGKVDAVMSTTALTHDRLSAARQKLGRQRAGGATELLPGVREAVRQMQLLKYNGHRKAVLVLSDGGIPTAQHDALKQHVARFAAANIPVYAIGLGVAPGGGNILKEMSGRSGGRFFGIAPGGDLVAESCRAAIQIALRLMPNNIYAFTDAHSPLQVPIEARRLVVVVPNGAQLRGPGAPGTATGAVLAGSAVRTTVRAYAGWKVVGASRPAGEADARRFWEGDWLAFGADGRRATAWGLLSSDIFVGAETADSQPSAEEHVRTKIQVSASAGTPAAAGPYSIRAYLKPSDGPAYSPVEEAITGKLPQATEMELPPVQRPGAYQLVTQVANPAGIIAAESRKPLTVAPSKFRLVVTAVSPDGTERTILESGTGRKVPSAGPMAGEEIRIYAEPRITDPQQQPETLSGGITLAMAGRPAVTRKLEVDRAGPRPRLVQTGMRITCRTRIRIDARGKLRVTSKDPILSIPTQSWRHIRAHWSFVIEPRRPDVETPRQVVAAFRGPPQSHEGHACPLAFALTTSGGARDIRTMVLRAAAEKAELVLTCPDGTKMQAPTAPQIGGKRVGPVEHTGEDTRVGVRWDLLDPKAGEYYADVRLADEAAFRKAKPPVTFVSEGGRFEVSPPWVVCFLQRTNRDAALLPLRANMTLVDGDEVLVLIRPTGSFPARLLEHVHVVVEVDRGGGAPAPLAAGRVERCWKTPPTRLATGTTHMRVRVRLPSGEAIRTSAILAVRPLRASVSIAGLPEARYPQDAFLTPRISAVPEYAEDLPTLVREEPVIIRLTDETGSMLLQEVLKLNDNGVATTQIRPPRRGRFLLSAAMKSAGEVSQVLEVTGPAVGVRMLATPPAVGDTAESLLAAPFLPPRLKPGQALHPAVIPTVHFPIEGYRIVSATGVLNGRPVVLNRDELYRWLSGDRWRAERDGELTGSIEVRMARVDGSGGMILRQEFTYPVGIDWPWHVRHRSALLALAGAVLSGLWGYRRWRALGDVSVELVHPYIPGLDKQSAARHAVLELLWPRLRYRVGAGAGDLKLPPEMCDGHRGPLLTLCRTVTRRLGVTDHLVRETYPLERGTNEITVGELVFQITDAQGAEADLTAEGEPITPLAG